MTHSYLVYDRTRVFVVRPKHRTFGRKPKRNETKVRPNHRTFGRETNPERRFGPLILIFSVYFFAFFQVPMNYRAFCTELKEFTSKFHVWFGRNKKGSAETNKVRPKQTRFGRNKKVRCFGRQPKRNRNEPSAETVVRSYTSILAKSSGRNGLFLDF